MLLGLIRLFGPGVVELLRVMWSPETGGVGGAGSEGSANAGGAGDSEGSGSGEPGAGSADSGVGVGAGGGSRADGAGGIGDSSAGQGQDGSQGQEQGQTEQGSVVEQLRTANALLVERVAASYRGRSDVIPEMISGSTVEELDASLQASQQAYHALVGRIGVSSQPAMQQQGQGQVQRLPPVAAGSGERRVAPGSEKLSAVEKISRGIEQRTGGRR